MADINMRILLSAVGGAGVSSAISSIGNSMGGLNKTLLGIGVAAVGAAVGLGVASVNAASQFQTAMDQNVAHAGLAKDQVDNVTKALLQMGPTVGQSPTVLAQAMYPVLSSLSGISNQGAKTALALDEVKLASESVAGSTTSVTSVTNAASAAFNAFGLQTNNANTNTARMNNLFDVMNRTVSDGNMQWSNYSNVIGKLSVVSHATGVSFNETNAALADLTNSGYSAQLGATYLGNTYNTLYIKTDAMAKNAKSLGIAFDETKYKTMNLGQRLTYLRDITGDNQAKLLKLMGGNSTALKTFDALSNSIKQYNSNLDDLNHSQGATAQAFETASSSFGFAMQRVQAAGQSLLITIGLQLLPTLTKIATSIIPVISRMSDWIAKSGILTTAANTIANGLSRLVSIGTSVVSFFQHNTAAMNTLKIAALGFLGAALGSLVFGFYTWAAAATAAAIATLAATWPFLLIGAAIGLVVGGFILAYNKITPFRNAVNSVVQFVTSNFMPAMRSVGNFLTSTFGPIFQQIGQWIMGSLVPALRNVGTFISSNLLPPLRSVGNYIATNFMPTLRMIGNFLTSTFAPVWQQLVSIFNSQIRPAFAQLVTALQPVVNAFKQLIPALQPLLPLLGMVAAVIGGVVIGTIVVGLGLLAGLIAGVVKGFAQMLPGIATAFAGIINVVKGFIQLVIGTFQMMFGLIQGISTGNWSMFQRGWQNMVNGVVSIVKGLWQMISGTFSAGFGFITGFLSGFVSTVVGFFTHLYDTLVGHSIIPDMVNAIVSWIAQLPGRVGAFIQALISVGVALFMSLASQAGQLASNLVSNVVNFFAQLPGRVGAELRSMISIATGILDVFVSTVFNIGANIVNNIANGIRSAVGNVTNAISSVTTAIGKFLPHSPAEQGELSHLNEYGPSLVTGFAHGVVTSLPIMQNAMGQLTGHVGQALARVADPSTFADQLSFTGAPLAIYSGTRAPVATRAVKQEEAQDRKEARKAAAEAKKEAAAQKREEKKAAADEKKHVHADIRQIKAELHIHTNNTKLDHAQIQEIVDRAAPQFGQAMAEQIRAQFGSI